MAESLLVRISILKTKEAAFNLTEEQKKRRSRANEVLEEVGGNLVLDFYSYTEKPFKVFSFPSLEAWEKYRREVIMITSAKDIDGLDLARYFEFDIDIGTERPKSYK